VNTNWSGTLDVCVDSNQNASMSVDEVQWIEQGIENYWGGWFHANGINISFSFRDAPDEGCGATDVKVFVDSSLSGSNVVAHASPTFGIGINPSFLDEYAEDPDFWHWDGAHEMGHVLGWDHNTDQDCAVDFTIMVHEHPNGAVLPSGVPCGDGLAFTHYYITGNNHYTYDDGWDNSIHYEDCWDHYSVTVKYWYDSDGFYHEEIVSRDWIDWTCTPPF